MRVGLPCEDSVDGRGLRHLYAREILGISERTAQNMAHLSTELRKRPLLRAAVRAGQVRIRKAQTVLPVAIGDAEAEWVEAARSLTVGTLEQLVRHRRASLGEDEEQWVRFRAKVPRDGRTILDEALAVAGSVLPGSTRAERLEAMAQELIAEYPQEAGEDVFYVAISRAQHEARVYTDDRRRLPDAVEREHRKHATMELERG